jgi:hypothetical protein
MGTQQILLIVLSVIIVGVAIVVGIGMFNRQAYNSKKPLLLLTRSNMLRKSFSTIRPPFPKAEPWALPEPSLLA